MNYNTVYVGMDVHKESFSLCAYTIEAEKASHYQRTEAYYKKVLNYLEFLRTIYGDDVILSILVYTFFTRMFDFMLPLVVKYSIVAA